MSLTVKALKKSPWVYHVAASPCNNCDIEILDLLTPRFDVERFGIKLVGSPRHADALLVTGCVNRHVKPRVIEVFNATPKPRVVFLIGACACSMRYSALRRTVGQPSSCRPITMDTPMPVPIE